MLLVTLPILYTPARECLCGNWSCHSCIHGAYILMYMQIFLYFIVYFIYTHLIYIYLYIHKATKPAQFALYAQYGHIFLSTVGISGFARSGSSEGSSQPSGGCRQWAAVPKGPSHSALLEVPTWPSWPFSMVSLLLCHFIFSASGK